MNLVPVPKAMTHFSSASVRLAAALFFLLGAVSVRFHLLSEAHAWDVAGDHPGALGHDPHDADQEPDHNSSHFPHPAADHEWIAVADSNPAPLGSVDVVSASELAPIENSGVLGAVLPDNAHAPPDIEFLSQRSPRAPPAF